MHHYGVDIFVIVCGRIIFLVVGFIYYIITWFTVNGNSQRYLKVFFYITEPEKKSALDLWFFKRLDIFMRYFLHVVIQWWMMLIEFNRPFHFLYVASLNERKRTAERKRHFFLVDRDFLLRRAYTQQRKSALWILFEMVPTPIELCLSSHKWYFTCM